MQIKTLPIKAVPDLSGLSDKEVSEISAIAVDNHIEFLRAYFVWRGRK